MVREAVRDDEARSERLSEDERRKLLATFDRVVPAIPRRPAAAVDAELAEIRAARRQWARRLYHELPRAPRRAFDRALAAGALTHGGRLWMLNPRDFRDVPDLALFAA